MDHPPLHAFRRCVIKCPERYPTLTFSRLGQFLCTAFAQLINRESLRTPRPVGARIPAKRYHPGIRGGIAKSTLTDANEKRDWRFPWARFRKRKGAVKPPYAARSVGQYSGLPPYWAPPST